MQVAAHLQSCEACRGRMEEMRKTWAVLGQWDVQPPPGDFVGRVLAAAREPAAVRELAAASRAQRWPRWGRIAAAVVIGSAAGVFAARRSGPNTTPPAAAPAGTSTAAAVEALGLEAIAGDTGLVDLFNDFNDEVDVPSGPQEEAS